VTPPSAQDRADGGAADVGDEDVLGEQRPLGDDEVQTSVFDSVEERTDL